MDSSVKERKKEDSPLKLKVNLLDEADEVLFEAKRLIPLNEELFSEFETRHSDVLCNEKSPMLDLLARSAEWTPDEIMNILSKLVPKYLWLLEYENRRDGYTPLHTALGLENHGFVQAVLLTLGDTHHLAGILQKTTLESQNSLASSSEHRKILGESDEFKDTPLHLVISKANPPERLQAYDSHQNSYVPKTSEFFSPRRKLPRHTKIRGEAASGKPIPGTYPVFSREQIVRLLVKHSRESVFVRNANSLTPYQKLEHSLFEDYHNELTVTGKTERSPRADLRELVLKDKVASYIMSYCMSNLSSKEISMALSTPDGTRFQAFDSELNLTNVFKTTIYRSSLYDLSQNCSFGPILKSVTLPKLILEEDPTAEAEQSRESMVLARKLSAPLAVFDWLRDQKVRRIIDVHVDDDTEPCSTNDAIEASLKGFEVQQLRWERADIPCDVFSNSTSALRHLSLYWSGEEAVLNGWSGRNGLSNTRKFPEIRTITLCLKKTSKGQTHSLVKCKETLEQSFRNSNRKISIQIRTWRNNDATDDNPWIDTMTRFTHFFGAIPNNILHLPKIALISDGVDLTSETLRGKRFKTQTGIPIVWGEFGTIAARIITQIFPRSELYIPKVEEEKSDFGNEKQALLSSAIEAIEWAISCDVDIIYMDLSVDGDANMMKDFEYTLERAHDHYIHVFCSVSPLGSRARRFYESIPWLTLIYAGTRFESSSVMSPKFKFPGKDIPLLDSGGLPSRCESGDRVATAIAAGIAGIVVFCCRLTDSRESHRQFNGRGYIEHAFKTRKPEKMISRVDDLIKSFQGKELDWESDMKNVISSLMQIFGFTEGYL